MAAELTSLLVRVQRIRQAHARALEPVARRFQLRQTELAVLMFLANHPALDTARDVVEYRGLSKSHVCMSVDALTQRGLLCQQPDRRDRRRIHLALTDQAQPIVDAAQQIQQAFALRLYQGITPQETQAYLSLSEKVDRNLLQEL